MLLVMIILGILLIRMTSSALRILSINNFISLSKMNFYTMYTIVKRKVHLVERFFSGCFYCFGCGKKNILPDYGSVEDPYYFLVGESSKTKKEKAVLKDFDWNDLLIKDIRKFHVISAPMGEGKTHQMARLCQVARMKNLSVCCVFFWRFFGHSASV